MSKFKVGDRVRTDGGNSGVIIDRFSDTLWDVLHEADALDRIADVIKDWFTSGENIGSLINIRDILRETGRL